MSFPCWGGLALGKEGDQDSQPRGVGRGPELLSGKGEQTAACSWRGSKGGMWEPLVLGCRLWGL